MILGVPDALGASRVIIGDDPVSLRPASGAGKPVSRVTSFLSDCPVNPRATSSLTMAKTVAGKP